MFESGSVFSHKSVCIIFFFIVSLTSHKKVQVGKDQEKAQSEKDSHPKNRGGKKTTNN